MAVDALGMGKLVAHGLYIAPFVLDEGLSDTVIFWGLCVLGIISDRAAIIP